MHDPQADEWEWIASYGFWIRHPKALESDTPASPAGLEEQADRFARFGVELHVLEADLEDCLGEFATAYEALYAPWEFLHLKKFAIVYHTDNFHVRVHKLREDVYRLLALVSGLDHSRKARRDEKPWFEQVKDALPRLGLGRVVDVLRDFEGNPAVRAAMDARHLFVHQFREESEKLLRPVERLRWLKAEEDDIARGLRWLVEHEPIDRHADSRHAELLRVLESVRVLRSRLYFETLRKLAENLERTPRAQRRPAHTALMAWWAALSGLTEESPPDAPRNREQ